MIVIAHIPLSSPAKAGDPVFQRHSKIYGAAAAYWIARSSRAMTSMSVAK